MLTDEELIDTIIRAPTGWNSRTTLLGLGRAVEAAVLEKQGRLLREAQMLAAPHFTAAPVAAAGISGGNSESECAEAGQCRWCGLVGPGFADSERPLDYCDHGLADAVGVRVDGGLSREHAELMLLAAADLESWMKSYHRDGATEDTVKRLRDTALGVPAGGEARPVTAQEDRWLRGAVKVSSTLVAPGKLADGVKGYDEAGELADFDAYAARIWKRAVPTAARDAWLERARRAHGVAWGADWLPTAENINALPEPLRLYIANLETLCDPAGIVRENTLLKDCNKGLQAMYRRAADAGVSVAGDQTISAQTPMGSAK